MTAPPRVPASHGFANFKYEPLDLSSKRPSIRLAVLQPGTKGSTVKVTLAQAAFADRPRYEALSYAWGSPDGLRGIELNGTRVDIRQNLWSALTRLRDVREERVLWVDAICINQSDIEERNHQVKLMAYIFSRAKEVLVWLGLVEEMIFVEKNFTAKGPELSPDMVQKEIVDLCNKPYWKRVWIVQEIGAATKLRVHWALGETGPNRSQPWEKFIDQIRRSLTNVDMVRKLAKQREDRHGDSFLLANLIEVCQESLCEEPKDKIYGFVGVAHDCQDDSLPVDYSKSLFELYEDVIRHQYHWTKENPDMPTANMRTIMHFSQVVQKVLGGSAQMEKDFALAHPGRKHIFPSSPLEDVALNFDPFKLPAINSGTLSISSAAGGATENFDLFKVFGMHSGSISFVGPAFSDIIGHPDASKNWKSTLSNCKTDLSELRRKNEGFMRTLLELNSRDLAKVCPIETHFSWKRDPEPPGELDRATEKAYWNAFNKLPRFKLHCGNSPASSNIPRVEEQVIEPRLFLTRNGVMGLMPPNAQSSDLIFQFWDLDTVAIVRRDEQYLRIIGRGVVSNNVYTEGSKFEIPCQPSAYIDWRDLFMDIGTLQLLTQ